MNYIFRMDTDMNIFSENHVLNSPNFSKTHALLPNTYTFLSVLNYQSRKKTYQKIVIKNLSKK